MRGHKSTNPSFLSLFISLYYLLLLLQTPPQPNHILFISATTARNPSKKTKGNFSASLLMGIRSIIAWLCNDQIGLLLWYNAMNSAVFYLHVHPSGWEHTVFLYPCPKRHFVHMQMTKWLKNSVQFMHV